MMICHSAKSPCHSQLVTSSEDSDTAAPRKPRTRVTRRKA